MRSRASFVLAISLSLFWFAAGCDDASPSGDGDDTETVPSDTAADDTGTTDTTPPTDTARPDSTTDDTSTDDTDADLEPDTVEDTTDDTSDAADSTTDTDGGGLPTGFACSADLRDVIGISGAVVGTCPEDMGCAEGQCVAACDAAEASQGNVACSFQVATAPTYPPALPPCHAVFLTNTWVTPARVTVTRAGQSVDVTAFARIPQDGVEPADWPAVPADGIPPDSVAVLFMSSDPAAQMPETGTPLSCPVVPAANEALSIGGSGEVSVWEIATDVPVSAYDILPFGGAPSFFPSAQLLLPTSVWGEQYVVVDTPPGTAGAPGPLWMQLVALEDGTSVTVLPTADLPAAGPAPAIAAGASGSFTADAGVAVQWSLAAGSTGLSGTRIVADKPVAIFAGNRFLRLQPTDGPGGESTHQQILPVSALSHTYVAAPYETRRADLAPESIPYRLVAAFDDTTLTYDPPQPGAPATLAQGEVADFEATGPFVVSSQDDQHPFALAQMMPTANLVGGSRPGSTTVHPSVCPTGASCPLGDEELVVVFPPAQYLSRYVFFTDVTYATTTLTLVRELGEDGKFAPVTIDCLGEVEPWQTVGSSRFSVTSVDLVRAGVSASGCLNGRHVAESALPFGLIVWGTDTYASYGYPAGGNAATLADLPDIN